MSLLLFIVIMGVSSFSIAQTSPTAPAPVSSNNVDFSTGDATDVSIGVLQAILGDWKSTTPDPTIGTLFKTFNLGVLVFAAALFMYLSVVGVIHSAEDGEVLGRNWGSVFVPLRIAGGMSLLFPLANGYSTVQIIVLWLATSGIGFANWVTVATIDSFVSSQGTAISIQLIDRNALNETMKSILKAEVCVADHNQSMHDTDSLINVGRTWFSGPMLEHGQGPNTYGRLFWGVDPLSGALGNGIISTTAGDVCGSITIPNYSGTFGAGSSGALSDTSAVVYDWLSGVWSGDELNESNITLRDAHFTAIYNASNELRKSAQDFTSRDPNVIKPTSDQLANATLTAGVNYRNFIASTMNTPGAIPSTTVMANKITEGVKTAGWSTLGTFFYQYARIGSELSKMTSYAPKILPPAGVPTESDKLMELAVSAAINKGTPNPATVDAMNNAGNAQGGIVGGLVSGTNTVTNTATRWTGETFGIDPKNKVNALMQLKNVGDNILSAAEALYIAEKSTDLVQKIPGGGTVVKLATSAAGALFDKLKGAFLDDAKGVMKYVGFMSVFALLGFAMMLAFWVPMSPFILWLGAVCGWFIAVIEMVVAAPLWAAAHLHPEGEGMASKYGANGYMIVLEVFAKPVLLVIGFFIAAKFTDVFLRFASALFFNNMATVNADSVAGIITALAFLFMYVSFCVVIVARCFSLIHVIPNSVLRWVGGGGDMFNQDVTGEMGSKIAHTMEHAMTPLRQGGMLGAAKGVTKGLIDDARKGDK